jgi:hypothetical protein
MPDRYDGMQINCHSMPYRDTMICSRYNVVAVGEVGDERLGILGGLG